MNLRLIRLYYFAIRQLQSLLPEEEREFVKAIEQIGTDQALEEIQYEWSRRKGEFR